MTKIHKIWVNGKAILAFSLLLMALMRLIWIQLRTYPPDIDFRSTLAMESYQTSIDRPCDMSEILPNGDPSPPISQSHKKWLESQGMAQITAYVCKKQNFHHRGFLTINQNLLSSIVFLAALTARLLTGGWMMPLVISVVLLSRGRLITSIGSISPDLLITFLLTFFCSAFAHFVRTGWLPSLFTALCAGVACGLGDRALIPMGLSIPLLIFIYRLRHLGPLPAGEHLTPQPEPKLLLNIWGRLRTRLGMHRFSEFYPGSEHEVGRPFSPLTMAFSSWVLFRKRWAFYGLISLVFLGLSYSAYYYYFDSYKLLETLPSHYLSHRLPENAIFKWFRLLVVPIDIDLTLALLTISIGIMSPRDMCLPGFNDICSLVVTVALVGIASCLLFDFTDYFLFLSDSPFPGGFFNYRATKVFIWLEPFILSLGILGVLNILNLFDAFISKKQNKT